MSPGVAPPRRAEPADWAGAQRVPLATPVSAVRGGKGRSGGVDALGRPGTEVRVACATVAAGGVARVEPEARRRDVDPRGRHGVTSRRGSGGGRLDPGAGRGREVSDLAIHDSYWAHFLIRGIVWVSVRRAEREARASLTRAFAGVLGSPVLRPSGRDRRARPAQRRPIREGDSQPGEAGAPLEPKDREAKAYRGSRGGGGGAFSSTI